MIKLVYDSSSSEHCYFFITGCHTKNEQDFLGTQYKHIEKELKTTSFFVVSVLECALKGHKSHVD